MDRQDGQDATTATTVGPQLRRVVGEALRVVALVGLGFALGGALVTEALGASLARGWPSWPTHLAAIVIGLTLGYAAAATVVVREVVVGAVKSVEWTLAEVGSVAERVVHDVETLTRASGAAPAAPRALPPAGRGASTWSTDGMAGGVLAGVGHDQPGRASS